MAGEMFEEYNVNSLLKKARSGDWMAKYLTGFMILSVRHTSRLSLTGYRWLRHGADLSDPSACYFLGVLYLGDGWLAANPAKAVLYLSTGAQSGDLRCMYELGRYYFWGTSRRRSNYNKAIHWLKKAAEIGHSRAQEYLGYMYCQGLGIKRNPIISRKWYLRSANQGNTHAIKVLGANFARNGNLIQTRKFLKQAIRVGDVEAMYILGQFLIKIGRSENVIMSGYAWVRAAEIGYGVWWDPGIENIFAAMVKSFNSEQLEKIEKMAKKFLGEIKQAIDLKWQWEDPPEKL